MQELSGISHGVRIRGRLPDEFRQFLRSCDPRRPGTSSVLDVEYKVIRRLPDVDEFWVGTHGEPQAESRFALFRQTGGFGLKIECQGHGLFRITPSTIRIEWLPEGTGAAHYFFSHALPLWLELHDLLVLHAGAVSFGDRAIAFLGRSGAGKSTFCNALVRLGCTFIADDGLALREDSRGDWHCASGPPFYRLWPSALAHQPEIVVEELPRVHERFEKRLLPLSRRDDTDASRVSGLSAVYVLERRSSTTEEIRLLPCTSSESLVRLVEFSLAAAPAEALGWTASRLKRLARLAEKVSVKHLIYPSGEDHWRRIRDTIVEDLERKGRDIL